VKSRIRSKDKGISTFIATLILMVLAVTAGVTIYAYMMGYIGDLDVGGGNNYKDIQIQSVAEVPVASELELWIYVKNIGKGQVSFDLNQNARLYINDDPRSFDIDHTVILEGVTSKISTPIPYEWSGKTINIKIVSSDGIFSTILYKVSGSRPALDHFEFDPIGPQTAGSLFPIKMTAKDSTGNIVYSYNGLNSLTSSVGLIGSISPGSFINGVWSGSIELETASSSVTISTSGEGKSGISNSFTVDKALPVISTTVTPTSPVFGETVTIMAELSGVTYNAGGEVTYTLYRGNGIKFDDDIEPVYGHVVINSKPFYLPSTGSFYFEVEYSGDPNNYHVIEPNVEFSVDLAPSTTSTTLSDSLITLGNQVYDTVTVIVVGYIPTGNVEFQVSINGVDFVKYGNTKSLTDGQATSDLYLPSTAMKYYFRALYSGDSNCWPSQSSDLDEPLLVKEIP